MIDTRPFGCVGVDLLARGLGRGDALVGEHVDAAAEREVHVFLAPHHALGHARRAAGVEQVDVVVGALGEVALGRTLRDRGLELDRVERGVVGGRVVPLDADEVLQLGLRATRRRDERAVLPLVEARHDVGVVEQVAQLLFDVAEVDVHRAGPDLVDREQRPRPTRCSSSPGCRRGRRPSHPSSASVWASRVERSSSSR